jgi:hypothetical protein
MASYGSASSISTFPRFPSLPPELRLRIWHFAMQTPQMIRLCRVPEYDKRSIYANPIFRPLLLVNVEARNAALSTYLPAFFDRSGSTIVWINPKLDTLYLNHISLFLFGKYEVAKYVEHIAVALEDWEWFEDANLRGYLCRQIKFLCDKMTALKEVQIVAWDEQNLSLTARTTSELWHSCSTQDGVRNSTSNSVALPFIAMRERNVEHFRQVIEQTSLARGFRPAKTPITVRPIAIGRFGVESLG